jgi:SAM-dependent methyltransferase
MAAVGGHNYSALVIYQHPLAYLLGLEGMALLRAWAGDYDQEFVEARLAEVRRLVNHPALANDPGVAVQRGDSVTGYRQWAPQYDDGCNSLFDLDEPVMHEILDMLPEGTALDAGCGTGRYAAYLATRGHSVIGVDSSPDMLDRARVRVPEGEFLLGDLHELPVPDDAADVIVSGLALAHVPDLKPVMREFARVLRPGGHLVISDTHHELTFLGSVVKALGPTGEPGLVATSRPEGTRLPQPGRVRDRLAHPPDRTDRTRYRHLCPHRKQVTKRSIKAGKAHLIPGRVTRNLGHRWPR